ncbi:MAG: hypothetical protein A2Y34_17345 [Spirochaetes bacterium GWC1_27_15]|nr:MAG: hypothetical protein A2Z98_10390 [Spirochaetes bacterium GWB1_27_13]OHD20655.1 MAG: hypothetical protein A2Y34_17345 [Spirochaetes bacterium GWC1_27_15]
MKRLVILSFMIIILIFSCTKKSNIQTDKNTKDVIQKKKIGLALGYGGIGDQSFNDMQYNGLINASRKFNIEISYKIPQKDDEATMIAILEELVTEKCDLIIASGYLMINPVEVVGAKYPEIMFALLDEYAKPRNNVLTVVYSQHEGSFVVGALAGMVTKTNKIGFIGGVNIGVIDAFLIGFQEGVSYSNKKASILVEYCSLLPDFSGFSNPDKGYNIAKKLYQEDCDIIYSVAGGTGNGIIQAAKDYEKFVIGVDANQDHLAKGYVLTSMMKRLDITVVDLCDKFIKGELKGNNIYEYGYKNGGVSITEMEYTKDKIEPKILNKVKEIEQLIKDDKIKVTNTLKNELK